MNQAALRESGVHPGFRASVLANLEYWRKRVAGVDERQFQTLDPEWQNLVRAVEYGLALPAAWEAAGRLALALVDYIESRGVWRAWIPLLERMLAAPPPASQRLQGRLACRLGFLYRLDGQWSPARKMHQQALAWAEAAGDRVEAALAHLGLADEYYHLHQYIEAEEHARAAVEALRQSGPQMESALRAGFNLLGMLAHARGRFSEAVAHYRDALVSWPSAHQPRKKAQTLTNLANTLCEMHRQEEALAALQEATDLLKETGSLLPLAYSQISLGVVYFRQRDFSAALGAFRAVDTSFLARYGYAFPQALLANNLGNVFLEQGNFPEADEYLQHASALWRELGDEINLANTLGDLGTLRLRQGQPGQAHSYWDEALSLLDKYPTNAWAQQRQQAIRALKTGA